MARNQSMLALAVLAQSWFTRRIDKMALQFSDKTHFASHFLPFVVLGVHLLVFVWLRKRSAVTQAAVEPGRTTFPPIREIRQFFFVTATVLVLLLAWCSISHEPREWWLPYVFMTLLVVLTLAYPRTLFIEMYGVTSRSWLGLEKTIRWEDVAQLQYAMDRRSLTIRDNENHKIIHRVFHAEPLLFRDTVRERTGLPLRITHRHGAKNKTTELPYRD